MSASGEVMTTEDYIGHHLKNLQLDLSTLSWSIPTLVQHFGR